MDFDPQKFFIGVIDFFSVLLPGALLTLLFSEQLGLFFLNNRYATLGDSSRWMVFLVSSYLLGHFIFLLGSFLMDDHIYDRMRQATRSAQIKRLAKGKRRAWWTTRGLATWLISEQSDAAVDRRDIQWLSFDDARPLLRKESQTPRHPTVNFNSSWPTSFSSASEMPWRAESASILAIIPPQFSAAL